MSVTTPAATQAATKQYLELKRLWQRLPDAMVCRNEHDQAHDESLRLIIEAAGLYSHDMAGASGLRRMLLDAGALIGTRQSDGSIEYVKGPFPEPVSPGQAIARENERIAARAADERERRERDAELRAQAQRTLDAPHVAARRAELDRQIDERLKFHGLI